jgi:hypothetical protein
MCLLCDPADIRRFVTAGRAVFTLSSMKTGARYTYRVSSCENRNDRFFVSTLTGPDNTRDFTYIGTMDSFGFRTTKKSKMSDDALPVRAVRFFADQVLAGEKVPETVSLEVRHEGRCGRCGRALTVPESIDRGIGPECAGKLGLE